ncbi:MAG: sugar transferase [Lachnospiraceae bacterium]|nr:sugar transferase [Lachnospiraceae bacterium]
MESFKRIIVLQLAGINLLFQVALYAVLWFNNYADTIQVYFWKRGHWLVIIIYGVLLFFFSRTYGGYQVGYLKPVEVCFSQIFATICANVFAYFQISLLNGNLIKPGPLFRVTLLDMIGIAIWTAVSNWLYKSIFAPRELLLIHGDRPIEDIMEKFHSRKDKYKICHCMNISEGIPAICKEAENRYDAVVIWDIKTEDRNKILKYCYGKEIRVYIMPKITDVIIKGSEQLHLFDTPILLTREYALKIEQRVIKRMIDLVCAILLMIITSPIMLITAICIKCYDGGPILYRQIRCTLGEKEFGILKFRSMRVDAEKDGVARLAAKNDSRITPIGKFIRRVRIDELPQLFNIIKGDMTFIGPRPERPEIIKQYVEEMPEFAFRTRVKAGLAGYAQVFGKYNTTPYDKLKLDLFYIENYTIWLDIKLMMLTLKILLKLESTEGVETTQVTAMKNEDEKS